MKALKWELVRSLSVAAPTTALAPSVTSTPSSKAGADNATPTIAAATTSPRVALNWRLKEGAALRRSSTTVLRSSAAIKALHKPSPSPAASSIQPTTTVSLKAITTSPAPTTTPNNNQVDDTPVAVKASPVSRNESSADDRASQASHRSVSVSSHVSSKKPSMQPADRTTPAGEDTEREAVQQLSVHDDDDDEAPSRASSGRDGGASASETTNKPKSQSRGGGIAAFIKRKLSGADKQADTKVEKSKQKTAKPSKERGMKALAADSDDDDDDDDDGDAGQATRAAPRRTASSTDEDAKSSARPQLGLRRLGDRAALGKNDASRRAHEESRGDAKAKPDQ
ncbi:hypothetical protein PINS_up013156 [Pythium insidiosum]|nr:hypothetical protein PINS_up013156 [Pythium insidiosum]